MTTTTPNPTADEIAETAAEAHRVEHAHTVYLLPGYGWLCEICDDDADEVVADYVAGTLRRPAPAPAPAPLVEYVVLVDLGEDVAEVRVEAIDPADARLVAAEQARNNGYDDAEAVSVELAS